MSNDLSLGALLITLAVVHAGACREQDVSCVSFFQQDLQAQSLAASKRLIINKSEVEEVLHRRSQEVQNVKEENFLDATIASMTQKLAVAKMHAPPDKHNILPISLGTDSTPEHDGWAKGDDSSKDRMDHVWNDDVFPHAEHSHQNTGDEGFAFFRAAPLLDWIVLLIVCIALILIDAFGLRLLPSTLRWHVAIIGFWIVVAALYNVWTYKRAGSELAIEWASGYILEWMLSVDNLFVFHLVLQSYKCPEAQVHKAVMIGIIGAVGMRLVFFMVVSTLLHLFTWFRYPFGALLIWSGFEAARSEDDDEGDLEDTRMVRILRWFLGSRLSKGYDEKGHGIFIRDENGRLQCTMLFVVLFVLEASDLLFALDSVSAKVAQIPQQYIAFSSSVLAMFGLRAMFFVVRDLVELFDLLKYGICLILIFIGLELMLSRVMELSSLTVCIIIVAVFLLSVFASFVKENTCNAKEMDKQSSITSDNLDTQIEQNGSKSPTADA